MVIQYNQFVLCFICFVWSFRVVDRGVSASVKDGTGDDIGRYYWPRTIFEFFVEEEGTSGSGTVLHLTCLLRSERKGSEGDLSGV